MNINILRYSLSGIAGGQEVDHIFPLTMIALLGLGISETGRPFKKKRGLRVKQ